MSDIHDLVVSLEQKILLLEKRQDYITAQNQELMEEKKLLNTQIKQLHEQTEIYKQKYDALKLTNAILGSKDKTEAKLKINALIREINACITQLSNR